MGIETITAKRFTTGALAAFGACLVCLVLAPSAWAGSYTVWTAGGVHGGPASCPDVEGPFGTATFSTFNRCHQAPLPGDYGVSTGAGLHGGGHRVFEIFAPPGTKFASGHVDATVHSANGDQARINIGNGSVHTGTITGGTSGWQGFDWSGHGNTTQFSVFVSCGVWCGNTDSSSSWAFARNLVFNMSDSVAPGISISNQLASSAWRNTGGTAVATGTDSGGGVQILDLFVNGARISRDNESCATTTLLGGTVGTRLTPCPTSPTISRSYGVSQFNQGSNTLRACAYDFSGTGNHNSRCTNTTVNIDTVAPASVSGMTLTGGEAWRSTNDFDVSWSNPAQAHAPIDGAMYRISRVGGGYDSGARFVSGSNRQSLSDLQVPSPGEYTLKVWARDAATNNSEASARTATLRFDPTIPPEAEADYNGWVRRNDFQYNAKWEQIDPSDLGPSGLDGYAVRVTQAPDSDPCVTAGHPISSCSSVEVNNDGIGDDTMPISESEVSEGQWYIHVVPVTGAGVKASSVEHTALPVDETDPESKVSGTDGEWVNHDVTVSVSASDPLSGMAPNANQYSIDPQPRTCVQVDSAGADCEPDDTITRVVSGEGAHEVRYFARDLAGNENNGVTEPNGRQNNPPNSATVKIDKSGPQLAFTTRTVGDPALIVVNASDGLSGLSEGAIELRREGSTGDWLELDTNVSADGLSGYVPDDLDPGRYEFRATGVDEAGNVSSTSTRADGSPMVEELPLKEPVNLTAQVDAAKVESPKGKGKCKGKGKKSAGRGKGGKGGKCKGKGRKAAPAVRATVPYGQPIHLHGHLRTASDAPLRARKLTVTERMAEGGAPAQRTHTVETDQGGAYSINLAAGPSRTVVVRFAGEGRYRPTTTSPVDVAVRSKILSFKSPKTVPESKSIRFRGQIGALGVDIGARGKRIELQYEKSKRNWKTIDSGEAKGEGRFKLRYGLRANYVRRTKVRFRILVPAERAWPYTGAAKSGARKTVILP
jgi:hypothetical protein